MSSGWQAGLTNRNEGHTIGGGVYRRGNPPTPETSVDKDHLRQRLRRATEGYKEKSRRDGTAVKPWNHANVLRVP
ncbi:hypothetical protein RT717_26165 [Imperialibacter roseus]|uniref:Uncharacterized protein n=1 Tax=Imperialibacter roseus TaxID=1324217 RepID=A0ABZ0IQ39_9BACT|nr:hypothetical protein [Imperialibacter roseus]WOK06564.1 hypothetical protein RT717_26165 [Imperialibacter roseus]